jgi:hypothetical protein
MMAGSNNGLPLRWVGLQWFWQPIFILSAKGDFIAVGKGVELSSMSATLLSLLL